MDLQHQKCFAFSGWGLHFVWKGAPDPPPTSWGYSTTLTPQSPYELPQYRRAPNRSLPPTQVRNLKQRPGWANFQRVTSRYTTPFRRRPVRPFRCVASSFEMNGCTAGTPRSSGNVFRQKTIRPQANRHGMAAEDGWWGGSGSQKNSKLFFRTGTQHGNLETVRGYVTRSQENKGKFADL